MLKPFYIRSIKYILDTNFHASAMILVATSLLSVSNIYPVFEFHHELYGPVAMNISMMLVYLAFIQILVWVYYQIDINYSPALLFGFILILLMGGLEYYRNINQIQMDPGISQLFLYVGLSHIIFGVQSIKSMQMAEAEK